MVDTEQAATDLEFVRQIVERREKTGWRTPRWLGVMWGVICLAGFSWIDVSPQTCWIFWMSVPVMAWVLSGVLMGKESVAMGEIDRAAGQKMGMHWSTCFFAGIPIAILSFAGKIDPFLMGQLCILVTGIIYYLGGIHFEKRWIAPGLVMIGGSVLPSFFHHGAWIAIGIAVFVTLVAGSFLDTKKA